jgi:hypothetical protein
VTGDVERIVDAIDRHAVAYMDVLLALAPTAGHERAKELTDALVCSSRAYRIAHTPGLPLMIGGVDCSPENVRRLMDKTGEM